MGYDLASCFTRLFVRYLARYTQFPVKLASFSWLINGPAVEVALDSAPSIAPLIFTWFLEASQMPSSSDDALDIMKSRDHFDP